MNIMSNIIKKTILFFSFFLALQTVFAQNDNPVINAIQKEVDRNKEQLKMEGMAPVFFVSYTVMDRYDYSLSASLGTISSYNEQHLRRGTPNLLVGDYHRNNLKYSGRITSTSTTSLVDNAIGIPISIWRDMDGVYKNAVEMFQAKLAVLKQQTQTDEEKDLPDFEQISPVNIILQPIPVNFDKTYWENYLRKASEIAKQYPEILNSSVSINVRNTMTYMYNTEGSRYAVPNTFYQLTFNASTRADDGQDLNQTIYREHANYDQIPDLATFIDQCKTTIEDLLKMRKAPVMSDAYSGPVMFENQALYMLFAQAFITKLAAAPKVLSGQGGMFGFGGPQGGNDFELMLNKKVISRDLSITSITGQATYKDKPLDGYYPVDAEGVIPDKELVLIENGVLRNMLNSRTPTNKIRHSNGHSRFDYNTGMTRVKAGNILITCNRTYSYDELRKKLLEAAKEEDLEYAYIVKFSMGINYYYKVYVADGREELVRGAYVTDGASLRPFKRILGASKEEMINNVDAIQTTIICPTALLFEEMDISRVSNIEFKKPHIVSKPQ